MKTKDRLNVTIASLCSFLMLSLLGFAADKLPDSTVTWNVKEALHGDPRVSAFDITASTDNGIVTLSGTVDNIAAKNFADQEAKKLDGVLGVVNRITVTPVWRLDSDLRDAVQRRILNSAVIVTENIKVACADGKVTLTGTVGTWTESEEAALLASEVRGVKDVVNNLSAIWATQRTDQEIKDDAVGKLERDVYLTHVPITVTVKDGEITLAGTVGTAYQKDRAHNDVRWLANVKGVKNDLKVEWWEKQGVREKRPQPTDAELEQAVRKELAVDSRVNASNITVTALFGAVTIDGTVSNHKEKRIAEQDAKDVVGVAWVNNRLLSRAEERSDWSIREDVTFNLETDATTAGFDIGVKVRNGVVTLSGSVHNWGEFYHAWDVALRIKGVKDVINKLDVDAFRPIATTREYAPEEVVKAVKKGLKANGTTKWVCDSIDVSVKDGVATLTGKVLSWAERAEATSVAFQTKGVWEVKNKLSVEGFDYNWDLYQDYGYPFSYPSGNYGHYGY